MLKVPGTGQRPDSMRAALGLARMIDAVNTRVGYAVCWLVLIVVIVSSGNALVRWLFSYSSNAYLDLQLVLFAAIYLLCAGYTFLKDEHVRIDIVTSKITRRARTWVDIAGILLFLLPFTLLTLWFTWPAFVASFISQETSANAGGLVVWPARLLVPVGFTLLGLQALSELIKRIAELRGIIAPRQDAESLAAQSIADNIQGQDKVQS